MFGLSGGHLIILIIIVLLLFGAKRLPELGSSLGKGIRSFKKGMEGIEHDDEEDSDFSNQRQRIASEERDSQRSAPRKSKKVSMKKEG